MNLPQPITFARTTWENDSLFSHEFGDIYFSTDGGRRESTEVYLNGNRLEERFSECDQFVLGEVGFGAALNFALTVELWKKKARPDARLFYLSYEKFPLEPKQIEKVLLSQGIETDLVHQIIERLPLPIESLHIIDFPELRVRLLLNYGDAREKLKETIAQVDAWFLDGFSPTRNPELWSEEITSEVSRLSHSETTAATYSVSGTVRERMTQYDWEVQKVPGTGAKKQILAARFKGTDKRSERPASLKVGVIGAGIVGSAVVKSFSERGAEVTLIDSRTGIAQAASGNEFGVVLPYPSRARDIRHRFYTSSFLLLNSTLEKYGMRGEGVLFHPLKDKRGGFFDDYARYQYPPEFAQVVNSEQASSIAGVKIKTENLFFPFAGSVRFPELCQKFSEGAAHKRFDVDVTDIQKLHDQFDLIVLAPGANFSLFPDFLRSFVQPLQGEVGFVKESAGTKNLKIPVCDSGYVCPTVGSTHMVASTYRPGVADEQLSESGERDLSKIFNGLFPDVTPEFVSRRVGVRVASRDRMPIIGAVGEKVLVSTAHGSRGGVSSLLCAEILAANAFDEPMPVEASVLRAIGIDRIQKL